jgi:hypoxanthine phosphoribosyltransferase|tara:strand:- start:1024 stop:1563 length:540 start_codon:yes stop_codon:yes gene_type:complete
MKPEIRLLDKTFSPYLGEDQILDRIKIIANDLERDYADKDVVFLSVLNGAFMFTSDLMKSLEMSLEISFVKLSSYQGTKTSGIVRELIGLNKNIKDKHVVIVEDIVDTGKTIDRLMELLKPKGAVSIETCTLLFKPTAFEGQMAPKYVGFEIPNKFVVGYGLDYDEAGRNIKELYQLKE